MRYLFVVIAVILLAACGQTDSNSTTQPATPTTGSDINADGSQDINSSADINVSLEINTPASSVTIPPGTVRYERQLSGNYFIKISGERPATQVEITIGSSVEAGEHPVEICPSFFEADYGGVCLNFIGLGTITRISDNVIGGITLDNVGETLTGILDIEIETPINAEPAIVSIVATFDALSLTTDE